MYLYSEKVVELISTSISADRSIEDNLYTAYEKLYGSDIVCKQEMKALEAWLIDYKLCSKTELVNENEIPPSRI